MFGKTHFGRITALLTLFLLGGICPFFGAGWKQLRGLAFSGIELINFTDANIADFPQEYTG